ncbi:endosome-associated-trafficking regulator 1 isoform X5 [Anguilla rostrata]|uniref:endosome-associated-trafficking regulator 1 isoform X5 n=1 Tax=Anguilla rostrata TaxID=7938 RepID=UPI0030CB0D55
MLKSSGMAKRTSPRKILIIEDDEHQEDQDELNPFSFKEFIRSKNLSSICGGDAEQKSHLPLELREENAQLRNHVKKLLKKSESDNQWIRDLKEQLHKQKLKEEREAQALETMVQSVEQNLQKMTKRAIKAETNASNLKQELLQLQDQLEVYRSDNERLRAAETTALNAMKQNAQIASEYLSKAANNAQTSIRQLLSDAETISLVSKMLYSIDKISDAR